MICQFQNITHSVHDHELKRLSNLKNIFDSTKNNIEKREIMELSSSFLNKI